MYKSNSPKANKSLYASGVSQILSGFKGVFFITATYVFFLLFAQFSFLKHIESVWESANDIRFVMAFMGISGILSSFFTSRILGRYDAAQLLPIGFLGCGTVAIGSLFCQHRWHFAITAALIGFFLAVLTVSLASGLTSWIGNRRIGLKVGLGTGIAYVICNVPSIFGSSTTQQAMLAAGFCFVGLSIGLLPTQNGPFDEDPRGRRCELTESDFCTRGVIIITLSFLALIWLDSAAFYIIQETIVLKTKSWFTSRQMWTNGITHLIAALVAGVLIDKGYFRTVLLLAFCMLATGFNLFDYNSTTAAVTATPVYLFGVSLYSVALVAYPSLWKSDDHTVSRRWRAGLLYGISGWFGSAMGIGMAQDLNFVPTVFILLAGMLILSMWLDGKFTRLRSG